MTIAEVTDISIVFMIAGGILAALVLMITLGTRRRTPTGSGALDPHEKLERINQTAEVKDELRDTMRELEDLARRLNSELDAKTMKLEKLLAEADRQIARLSPAGNGISPTPASVRPEPEDPPMDPIAMKICALADAGKKPMDIARELGEHIGKVELILALRQQVR